MSRLPESSSVRVMLFIDLQSVLKGANMTAVDAVQLELSHLALQLISTRRSVVAYVFDSLGPKDSVDLQRRAHARLKYHGFRMVALDACDGQGNEQNNVNVAIASEMMAHAFRDHYDVAILVGGNQCLLPATRQVQASGRRVEMAAFIDSSNGEILSSADRFYDLKRMPFLPLSSPEEERMPAEHICNEQRELNASVGGNSAAKPEFTETPNMESGKDMPLKVRRIGPNQVQSSAFREGRYSVHVSIDRTIMTIRADVKGNVSCVDGCIAISGLGLLSRYKGASDISVWYDLESGCYLLALGTEP